MKTVPSAPAVVYHPTMVADGLLFITALIWGLAFVAQRFGMEYIGPFTFNGIRFLLGAATLVPPILMMRRRRALPAIPGAPLTLAGASFDGASSPSLPWRPGFTAGIILFVAASLQQVGLVYTTAGNAGFITGLYVVFVPLLGLFQGQRPGGLRWVAVVLAATGMYFLSVRKGFSINPGDLYVLASAFFFALHVQYIGRVAGSYDPLELSVLQYLAVGTLSAVTAILFEEIDPASLRLAAGAILYGGLGSITIAYTLQVIAQRRADPTHAAIILSLEGTFAAIGGWFILREVIGPRGLVGCALILAGMMLSQLVRRRRSV